MSFMQSSERPDQNAVGCNNASLLPYGTHSRGASRQPKGVWEWQIRNPGPGGARIVDREGYVGPNVNMLSFLRLLE
jgi:hypothetical protein